MAPPTPSQPQQKLSGRQGYIKSNRKQYQSCDHCRKSRRACDAAALGVQTLHDHQKAGGIRPTACSNCSRLNKPCTFDWLLAVPNDSLPQGIKRKFDSSEPKNLSQTDPKHGNARRSSNSHPNRNANHLQSNQIKNPPMLKQDDVDSTSPFIGVHIPAQQTSDQIHNFHAWDESADFASYGLTNHSENDAVQIPSFNPAPFYSHLSRLPLASTHQIAQPNYLYSNGVSDMGKPNWSSIDDEYEDNAAAIRHRSNSKRQPNNDVRNMGGDGVLSDVLSNGAHRHNSTSSRQSYSRTSSSESPMVTNSFSTLQHHLAESTNKSLIADGLLRIYNDTLEHALSCWVTTQNCPYGRLGSSTASHNGRSTTIQITPLSHPNDNTYSRVCRLDTAFSPFRTRPLTTWDDMRASRALNTAIMAFASQWTHVRQSRTPRDPRQNKTSLQDQSPLQTPMTAEAILDALGPPSTEFERLIQESLWYEARKSLQYCGQIDSFKSIFAHMVFALVQKPLEYEEFLKVLEEESTQTSRSSSIRIASSTEKSMSSKVSAGSESSSTPPVISSEPDYLQKLEDIDKTGNYLEIALQHLFNWRRTLEVINKRRRCETNATLANSIIGDSSRSIPTTDKQSFDMLFWLGIMCDTTAAALGQRAPMISDDDCALLAEDMAATSLRDEPYSVPPRALNEKPTGGSYRSQDPTWKLWELFLLRPDRSSLNGNPAQWPCSFEQAKQILDEAIPVKVLLWRKLAVLQTLTSSQAIETCIKEALLVYQHWNSLYGQFMQNCISDHNNLPSQIQSWYIILDGHWHLACLLIANCIEQIDDSNRSESLQRYLRQSSNLILELRKENAYAISDLASVSSSKESLSFRDSGDFHFAVSDGALLTEPWTNVLMQALGKACHTFLSWLSCWNNPTETRHSTWVKKATLPDDLRSRAQTCIQAIRLLGQKSDTATLAALLLQKQLDRCNEPYGTFVTPNYMQQRSQQPSSSGYMAQNAIG